MSSDPEMGTRKLQKVGGSTYTVSIPKRWAREHGLAAGDEVHLYGHGDGSLVVRNSETDGGQLADVRIEVGGGTDEGDEDATDEGDEDATDEKDANATTEEIERALRAAYASGFEEIELVADDGFSADQRRAAGSLARTLVGTELVEEGDDRLAVRNLLDPGDVSVRQSLIQLEFVALSIHRAATAAVAGRAAADHVPGRDDEVDRLFAMITRHFERSLTDFAELDRLGLGRTELFEYYLAARQLERVADHAVEIARVAERLDAPPSGTGAGEGDASDGNAGDTSAGDGSATGGDRSASEGDADDELASLRDDLESVADASRRVVEDATDAVLDGDAADAAHAALDLRDETVADAEALDRALFERGPDDAYRLTRVVDSLVRTARLGGNVAEIAVQSAVRGRE